MTHELNLNIYIHFFISVIILGIQDASVDFNTGTATVTYNPSEITMTAITGIIEALDYRVLEDNDGAPIFSSILGTGIIILALYVLLQQFGMVNLTSAFPLAEAGMGYGMLFVIGLITSVHCIAMCGGINLSQCLGTGELGIGNRKGGVSPPLQPLSAVGPSATPSPRGFAPKTPFPIPQYLFPSILYNAGRVLSYTLIGALVGALGSVITVSGRFQGILQLIAGVFMVIMGINMLGFFPFLRRFNVRMPRIFAKKIEAEKENHRNPLIIGLLNGLMPCGPLQAIQLYALSTGSPLGGAISMFLFSMGTVLRTDPALRHFCSSLPQKQRRRVAMPPTARRCLSPCVYS